MFIAKSCTQEELETLKLNAHKYSAYMCANKNSYISRVTLSYCLLILSCRGDHTHTYLSDLRCI